MRERGVVRQPLRPDQTPWPRTTAHAVSGIFHLRDSGSAVCNILFARPSGMGVVLRTAILERIRMVDTATGLRGGLSGRVSSADIAPIRGERPDRDRGGAISETVGITR